MLSKLFSKLFTMNIYHLYNQGRKAIKSFFFLCKVSRSFWKAVHTQVLAVIISSWSEDRSILGPSFCSILSFFRSRKICTSVISSSDVFGVWGFHGVHSGWRGPALMGGDAIPPDPCPPSARQPRARLLAPGGKAGLCLSLFSPKRAMSLLI